MSNHEDSDNDIDEDEEWARFEGFDDEIEELDPAEDDIYLEERLTEKDCGFTFKWDKPCDVPLDKMLSLAFKCGTPKVWTLKTKLGDLIPTSEIAIIGAHTKEAAAHLYTSKKMETECDSYPAFYAPGKEGDILEELEGISRADKWKGVWDDTYQYTLERIALWAKRRDE